MVVLDKMRRSFNKDFQNNRDCKNKKAVIDSEKYYAKVLLTGTYAENKFYSIALKKKLKLERQYKIYIKNKKGIIVKFYFADFCDTHNKIVFEVDGGYHTTEEQMLKDKIRDSYIRKMGYKVFRITNDDVYNGKTTQFLVECYKKVGVNLGYNGLILKTLYQQ